MAMAIVLTPSEPLIKLIRVDDALKKGDSVIAIGFAMITID